MRKLIVMLMISAMAGCSSNPGADHKVTTMPQVTQFPDGRDGLGKAGLVRKTLGPLVYWTGGKAQRPPLVLIHGVNDQAGSWADAAAILAADYRLIIPDVAGHGESGPETGPIMYAAMLEGIESVIDHEVPVGKVTLAGNSMGGWLSMLYALDHPERVERLVLENASGMMWMPGDVPLIATNREEAARVMRAVHGPQADTSEATLDLLLARKNTQMSRIVMEDALSHFVDKRLHELTMPVTLIWGRHDGLLPVAYAEALHKKVPGSTLSIIEDAAHIPHRQQPRKFAQCLKTTC
jgi:pimeloyl-ACP methyl ester carboxylesterase